MIEKIPNAINAGTASDPYKNATVRTIAKPDAQPTMQIPALPNVVKATHEQYQGIASSDTGFLRSASLKYQRLLGETQQTEQDVARLDYAIWMSDRAGVSVDHAFHHAEDVQKRLFDYADNISVYDGWKYFNEYMKKTNFEEKVLDKIDARFEGLYNSNLSSEEKEAGYEELRQEYLKAMAEFPSFKHAESWVPTSWLEGVASTVPYMTKIATAAAAGAAFMGLGAMALGSFGTLSPIALAATPMLAATAKFAMFGAAAGGFAMSKQLIQNQHTISRLMWEDEQGNHLDPRVVYWSRHLSSALSAGTEMWAASAVLGGIGKLLFGNTLESVISTSLWKRAMQGGLLYAKGVGVESFEEGLQKVTEDVTDNLAKWVDSKLHGTNWDYVGFKDMLKNAAGDFLQSVPTMMTLGLIPFAGSTAVSMATAKGDARADARVYFDTESGETVSAWNIHNPVSEYDKDAVGKRIDAAAKGRQKLAPIKVVPAGQSRDGMQQYRVVEGMDTYQALFERGVQNMQVEVKQRSDYTQQLGEDNYAAFGEQVNNLASSVGGRVDIQGGTAYVITGDAQKAFEKKPEGTLAIEDNSSIPGPSGRYSVDLELDVAGQSGRVVVGTEGTWAADRLVGSTVESVINELEAQDVNTKAMRSVMSAIYRETRVMDAAQAADHITKASPRLMRQLDKLTPEQQELPSVQQLRSIISSPFDASTLASTEAVASAEATKKPPYEMTPEEFAEAAQKEGGVEELIAERKLKAKQENAQQDWEKAADAPVSDKAERHAEAMQKVVDAIDAKVGTKTQVVAEADNLPAAVKQAAIELGLGPKDIKAAYHNGSVFIVAESSTADSIEATFAHEWVAHRGLRVLLGNEYEIALTTLYDRIGEKRIRSVVPASVQGQSKAYQVDEYLAIKAGQLQKGGTIESVEMGFLERAMDAVRRVLRELGFKVRMTDLEVRRLLADANAALGESVTDVDGKTTETEEAPPIEETEDVRFEIAEDYQPQKTGKGFKLFDMVGGKLFPLFIGSNRETPVGVWLKAENLPTKGFAKRPGWHIGSTTPDAPWLKGDNGTDVGTYRSKRVGGTRVWAEVEYPMDVDYQPQADKAPTKDLPDTIPDDGYYLFKEGQRGTWVVSGALKVNRILPNEEIAGILEQQGYDQISAFEPYRNAIIKRKETIAKKNASKDIRFQQMAEDYRPDILFQEEQQSYNDETGWESPIDIDESWEDYMALYNAGPSVINEVEDRRNDPFAQFDGLFASGSFNSASAHGDVINAFKIADEDIATSRDLDNEYEKVKKFLKRELGIDRRSKIFDTIYDAVVWDKSDSYDERFSEAFESLNGIAFDDPGWFAQRLRGRLAAELGFKAVEMEDEHGTSYYIVPGVKAYKPSLNSNILFQGADYQSQYNDTKAKYESLGWWMLAPNGSQTNLTEQQWVTVRTPSFLNWFGDWMNDPKNASKVVDENGEPLVVYHGTENEFTQFDFDYKGTGGWSRLSVGYANAKNEIYLTSSLSHAEAYGQYVMPLFTRIIDPLKNNAKRVLESWRKEELKQYPTVQNMIDEYYEGDVYNAIDADGYFQNLAIEAKLKGKDGVIVDFGDLKHKSIGTLGKVIIVFSPTQIKSATDNLGTFDEGDSDIRFEQKDKRYFDALERGDEETARRIVDEVAKQKGYISSNDFRMNHKAPNSKDGFSARLDKLDESEILPKDFWEHPQWYTSDNREMRSFWKVKEAFDHYQKNGKAGIRLYRAIPKNVKEDMFRNGDWVTPDREYAVDEGLGIPGGYRIIVHQVPIEHVWWDVNSIAELGYDDGREYAYRDTRNNRKLNDTIVRDIDGSIVPPSKRFNYRSYTMFEQAPPVGSPEFKTLFGNSKAVDENGNPKLLYHGSPNKSITALDNTGVRRINGGEPGYIYATDGYDLAEKFSREKFRGQSNLSVILGDTGRVYPVYMRMENPLDFRNLTDTDIDNMVAAARKYSQFKNTVPAQLEKARTDKGMAQQYLKREAEDLVSRLQEYGYDGLIAEAQNGGPYEYAVVSPSQVYMAEPQDTRFEQRVRDPYLKWEPEETSTGTIKGAPEWVKTRKDLNKLRSLLRKLVKEGESGRYWYEESAEEVWRITQGDPEKTKKLIQLLAIYSPNNNVPNNTLMAIRAYNHWASGLAEEDLHSGMGELDEKARRALYHNEDWEGRKTGSFYDNLIYELVRKHPEAFPDMDITDVGTMDLWMARAFGYQVEAYSDDKGTGKYSFSENSTRRLAAELNAKLQPGEDPWTTHQIQAAIWSSMKTRYEIDAIKEMTNKESIASGWAWVENGKVKYPTSGESEKLHKQLWRKNALEKSGTSEEVKKLVEETGFSFKQAIYDSSQVVTWEANPSTALGYEINNASGPVLSGFTAKAVSLVVDPEGADMLAGKLGVPLSFIAPGSGAYAGAVSPNAQSNLFPTRIKGEGVSFDIVRKYARAIQYIFKQDAVPFFKPDSTPLTSESAKKEMLFKTVKYTRDEDGAITKTTTIPGSKFDTQAEADAFRDAYIAKKKLNPDDVAVHGGKYAKAVVMTFQDKLDRDKLISVLGELKEYLGDDAGYTKTGSNEITFINFRDDFTKAPYVYDETYLDGLGSFYEDYKDSFGIVSSTEIWTEGEYGYEHDWAEDPSGSKVLAEAGIADGSDLHSWVLGRRALFEALIKEYSGENLARIEELYRQGQLTEDTRFELSESGMAADLEGSETTTRKISDRYMQRHRTQVQAAMKRGLTVPDRVLEAYAGEEWADKELADRKLIRSFSWILPLAKDVNTPEELKALVEEELQKQGFDVLGTKTPEDVDFYKRLLELSSPTTKQMYIDSFMDIVNSDRNLRSLVQDISEARENWQGLGLPSFIWGLASKVGNGAQITDADLDMIRSYTVRNREKMATAYYASRGDTAALSKMGSEDIVYGTEEPERRAINAALIKDPEVLRQMLDGSITYGRLVEYEEQIQQEMAILEGGNDDLQAQIDSLNQQILEQKQEQKQQLSELRDTYKQKMTDALTALRDKQKERDEVRMAREFVERVAARMRRPVPPQTTSYTVGRKMEALAEFVIPSKWYRMEKTEDGLHRAEPDSARATALIYYLSDPADDVETFLQDIQQFKDLTFGDFTTDQIALLYGITEHIRERGRREMAAFLEAQRMRRDVAVNKILAEVLGGEKAQVFENIGSIESDKEQKSGAVFNAQAMSLRPPRMILLMSGGKEGVMYDWYINKINEATDAEIRNYQRRMKAGQQKMKELGITVGMLEKELTYNDVTMRTDDVLHLWIGMKNEKNRNAILYGNRIEIGVVSGLTSQLTENQKAWATYMLDDFEAEYDRLNQTFIADRNQDMGKEQNYFTMIRQDLDQMPLGDEFASQIAVRNAWRKGYPNKSFSKERIEIADEHQKPIRLGATQIWFEQVSKQEHYIASAILAKDLQYIADNQVLRDGLKQRFGRRANSWLRKYVNDWANPTMYKSFDSVTRWMGVVRNNMAVAYLGFNLLTVLKQAPSLAFYLKGANPMNLLAAASEMVLHPFETIRFVEKMDPQIAARSYDRLTEELKGYDPNKGVRAIRKVGQVSMKPIMWMDKAMVTIGWLAVYKNQIAKGASELEAAREAQKVTLDTQPAGRPKDVAEMYRSNELANWFTMFSNQLNQIWNMYTFDIPNAIKEREAAKLAGILAGIGVSGIAIAYLSGWRAPEDPEDLPKEAAVELFKNFLSVVPFLGNGLKSGYDKFYGAGLDPFPIAYTAGKLMADISGDPEKIGPDIASLVEDLAILTGLPVTGTKRLVNVGRYQHLNELLGYGFAQYTR